MFLSGHFTTAIEYSSPNFYYFACKSDTFLIVPLWCIQTVCLSTLTYIHFECKKFQVQIISQGLELKNWTWWNSHHPASKVRCQLPRMIRKPSYWQKWRVGRVSCRPAASLCKGLVPLHYNRGRWGGRTRGKAQRVQSLLPGLKTWVWSRHPHGTSRVLTPTSCPLTFTYMLCQACPHGCAKIDKCKTNKQTKTFLKVDEPDSHVNDYKQKHLASLLTGKWPSTFFMFCLEQAKKQTTIYVSPQGCDK